MHNCFSSTLFGAWLQGHYTMCTCLSIPGFNIRKPHCLPHLRIRTTDQWTSTEPSGGWGELNQTSPNKQNVEKKNPWINNINKIKYAW